MAEESHEIFSPNHKSIEIISLPIFLLTTSPFASAALLNSIFDIFTLHHLQIYLRSYFLGKNFYLFYCIIFILFHTCHLYFLHIIKNFFFLLYLFLLVQLNICIVLYPLYVLYYEYCIMIIFSLIEVSI